MKLSQLFSGDAHTENIARPGQSPAQAANLARQIRSLVPGQTISGEVLSRNGGEVQIRISEDLVLNARVDRNMNIEVGKNMTFEVKNNGSSLALSPLFTNVSTDMNVLKALDMAGLPVNQTSVDMTEQMMQAGLPVNKNMLQQIFREINSFPENDISDVINLHRLQLPVNEANMEQMAAYRNLKHQLAQGIDTILDALPEVFDTLAEEGDISGAVRLYREVLALVREEAAGGNAAADSGMAADGAGILEKETLGGQQHPDGAGDAERPAGGKAPEVLENIREAMPSTEGALWPEEEFSLPDALRSRLAGEEARLSEQSAGRLAGSIMELLESLELPEKASADLRAGLLQFVRGQTGISELFSVLGRLADGVKTSEGAMHALVKMFSDRPFRELLSGQLKNFWTLSAEEVGIPGKVEEMYRHLDRQLKGIAQALDHAGQTDSTAFKASVSMARNVDFLQQINQMYAYVQLPLRLSQGNTHGELYVYTNKKKLTAGEGAVSALLHLDMENLGPLDVYVAMQSSKVNTKFFLQDESMIDFMAGHMDILTERLKKRGYDCSYAMTVHSREEEGDGKGGGLSPILKREKGIALSQYAFDVRT